MNRSGDIDRPHGITHRQRFGCRYL